MTSNVSLPMSPLWLRDFKDEMAGKDQNPSNTTICMEYQILNHVTLHNSKREGRGIKYFRRTRTAKEANWNDVEIDCLLQNSRPSSCHQKSEDEVLKMK